MNKIKGFPEAEEISLPNAPLVRVLAQVRFETILAIQNQGTVAPFQEAIREAYPVLRAERTKTIVNGPEGVIAIDQPPVWKFSDLAGNWKVSLAPDFIALETTVYKSRADFMARFEAVLSAFGRTLKPGIFTRIGIRYIDRLSGDALATIGNMVRQQLVGILQLVDVEATASEALFKVDENQLFARWGLLPPKATMDPAALEPMEQTSWVLDIDSSNSIQGEWDLGIVSKRLQVLASNSYNFFRWAITDEFLRYCGGNIR